MNRLPTHLLLPVLAIAGLVFLLSLRTEAQTLIRDAEIEHISRQWATPLFKVAGLDPNFVKIYLVRDNRINAFVAGGRGVFLNTGLLMAAESPMQIVGVLAHEIAHIAAGHLARTQTALQGANVQAIATLLLGAAVIAGGGGDAGAAVILGGRQVAERGLLRYSRAQEAAADLAGVRLMDDAGFSARHAVQFMELLAEQATLLESRQDPYVRSHPMFPQRVSILRSAAQSMPNFHAPTPVGWEEAFDRVQAKLVGYLERPARVLRNYPLSDSSLPARYARAVMFDQAGRLGDSLTEIEALMAAAPDDPFFHELHGQVLLQHGQIEQALHAYARAVEIAPQEPQLRSGLAAAQIAAGRKTLLAEAITHLQAALLKDSDFSEGWRHLAIAWGRLGNIGQSALASAEQHIRVGHSEDAMRFCQQALRLLPVGSPGWLRAKDIENVLEATP